MDATSEFIQMVESLCAHRSMYVCEGTFYELCAYLEGYAAGSLDCPLGREGWDAFNRFVCAYFRFPDKYTWPYVLKCCTKDDDDATEHLRTLLTEFCHKARTSSYEEMIQEVTRGGVEDGEGAPEQVVRRLLAALLRGNRPEIEPLIQEHADAGILWEGAYPSDVAEQLDLLSRSNPIARLSGTEEEGEVRLITADFPFPITLRQIAGQWKVDVAKIIEMRKGTGKGGDSPSSPRDGSVE
jgi:hypothetical protein